MRGCGRGTREGITNGESLSLSRVILFPKDERPFVMDNQSQTFLGVTLGSHPLWEDEEESLCPLELGQGRLPHSLVAIQGVAQTWEIGISYHSYHFEAGLMAQGLLMGGLKWQEGADVRSDGGQAVGEVRVESFMLSRSTACSQMPLF